jgi:AcrR family transcriptional regulator
MSSSAALLKPRKSPVQARSSASVEAILDATIQVLLSVGKERLTTTRVAMRAGVSVGTLYQYFPNKSALLRAALSRHLEHMREAMREVIPTLEGASLEAMMSTVAMAFLAAKMRKPKTGVALYSVSADVDGFGVAREIGDELQTMVVALLKTAKEPVAEPEVVASVLLGAMGGVSRRLVESKDPERSYPGFRRELDVMVRGYAAKIAACEPQPHASRTDGVPN